MAFQRDNVTYCSRQPKLLQGGAPLFLRRSYCNLITQRQRHCSDGSSSGEVAHNEIMKEDEKALNEQ